MKHYGPRLYRALMRVRPAQLADLLKSALGIHRQYLPAKGCVFWADPVSVFGQDLLQDSVYEAPLTHLVEILLRPSDIFIDLGGNEGYFSVLAASLVPQGHVHCIEPQGRLLAVLHENLRINGVTGVTLHRLAITDRDGEMDLFLRPSTNSGASSLFRHWKIGSTKERVPTASLDSFFSGNRLPRARLVKVDCEGAEWLVVQGGQRVLREGLIDFIAMEYHPTICGPEKVRETHTRLVGYGYDLVRARGHCLYHLPSLKRELEPLGELETESFLDA